MGWLVNEEKHSHRDGWLHAVASNGADLAVAPDDAAHRWVVGGYIDLNCVAGDDADHPSLAHLSRCAGGHLVTGLELHAEGRIRKRLYNDAFGPEIVVLASDVYLQSCGDASDGSRASPCANGTIVPFSTP